MRQLHFLTRLLIRCFLVSLSAPIGVLIIFHDLRPLVSQSFIVSFAFSVAITLTATALLPAVVRRVGKPGVTLTVAVSAGILVSAALGSLVGEIVLTSIGLSMPGQFWNDYFFFVRITAALALVFGLSSYFYGTLTSQLKEARTLALEAKLSSLESRVQPHFLFNALNSISALIRVDPKRAEETVGQLATLLRSSLNSTEQRLIPLRTETRIVRDYLAIEKTRFGARLEYALEIPADTEQCLVPPFSVQSLVENAVKHAVTGDEGGGRIEIVAARDHNGVRIEVRDSGAGFDLSKVAAGRGLDNLTARLDSSFGAKAGVEVARRENRCVVTLRVPA